MKKRTLVVEYKYNDPLGFEIVGKLGKKIEVHGEKGRIIYTSHGPVLVWRTIGKFVILGVAANEGKKVKQPFWLQSWLRSIIREYEVANEKS